MTLELVLRTQLDRRRAQTATMRECVVRVIVVEEVPTDD